MNSNTVPSPQTSQFCLVNLQFHCITLKIIETLLLNANTTNAKQLSGPEKLPREFKRNRRQVSRFSKVPLINGPGKLSPFTLKIEISIVLHLT